MCVCWRLLEVRNKGENCVLGRSRRQASPPLGKTFFVAEREVGRSALWFGLILVGALGGEHRLLIARTNFGVGFSRRHGSGGCTKRRN